MVKPLVNCNHRTEQNVCTKDVEVWTLRLKCVLVIPRQAVPKTSSKNKVH